MANKDIVSYVNQARVKKLSDREVFQNLKNAGWHDSDIKEAFVYIDLFDQRNPITRTQPAANPLDIEKPDRSKWVNFIAIVIGYTWLISGINKILNSQFVLSFGDYVKSQIENAGVFPFYKNVLINAVLPNAELFAQIVKYAELAIGALLFIFGLYNLFKRSRLIHMFLVFAYLGSLIMILNIIFSSGVQFPWVNTENIYSGGVGVEYMILFLSFFAVFAHFSEAAQD